MGRPGSEQPVDVAGRRRMSRRVTALLACAAAAGLATGWTAALAAEPHDAVGCPIVASAQAVQQTVQKTGDLVLNDPAGAAAPVAQACINYPLEISTGFASGAAPKQSAQPVDYPANVSSSYPTQPSAHDDSTPGVTLVATSTQTASTARATDGQASADGGPSGSDANVHAGLDVASGSASAVAASVSAPLNVGGVLSVGEVHSTASASIRNGEPVRRSSSLEIGRTTIGGQVVTITPDGIKAAGQTLPLPSDPGVGDVLRQAGVEIRYLSPEKTPHGILSGGVLIRAEEHDSTGAATVVEYVLGRAYAAVTLPAAPTSGTSAPPAPPATGGGGAPQAPPPSPPGSSTSAPTAPAAAAAAPVVAGSGPGTLAASGSPVQIGLSTFYLVLVIGGAVMLVSSSSVRLFGVRSR